MSGRDELLALARGDLGNGRARELAVRLEAGDAELSAALVAEDEELSRVFGGLGARLVAAREPSESETAREWARLQAVLPGEGGLARAWRSLREALALPWLLVPAAAVAAAVALVLLPGGPGPERPGGAPVDSYVKGAAAGLELELLLDAPDGPRLLQGPASARDGDRIVARLRSTRPAWLYFVHRGPAGEVAVLPFASDQLPAGRHIPMAGSRPLAYDLSGEPGAHRLGVVASPVPLSPADVEAALRRGGPLPGGAVLVEQAVEAR